MPRNADALFPVRLIPGTRELLVAAQRAGVAEQMTRGSTPPQAQPSDAVVWLNIEQFSALIRANFKMGELLPQPFIVGTVPVRLRPREDRTYLLIINYDTVDNMAVGVGKPPGATTGTPVDGIVLGPNRGSWEPPVVPQNEIWVVGAAAATPGFLVYSVVEGIKLM